MHCNSALSAPLSKAKSVGALLLSASLGLVGCQETMTVYGGGPEFFFDAGVPDEGGTEGGAEGE